MCADPGKAHGGEQELQTLLDSQQQRRSAEHLEHLRPPDGLRLKADILPLQRVAHAEAEQRTQQRAGVLAALKEVVRVDVRRETGKIRIDHIGQRHDGHHAEQNGHFFRVLCRAAHDRIDHEDQHNSRHSRHADVQRRVHAEIHAGKCRQRREHDAHDAQRAIFVPAGNAAERADGVLRVAGREGIAARPAARAFHDRKIRIAHPWPRDAAQQLEELIEHRAEEADKQQIIAFLLADAPEDRQRQQQERQLLAEAGERLHDGVEKRAADGFEPV